MMLPSLSRRVEAFWYGSSPLAVLLQPLSWLFQAAVWLRRLAYRVGLRQQVRLPVPVVIVGNLSVGGTGKTPIVIWLADWLRRAGYRPGIVSRGYGGRRQENGVLVTAASDPVEVGDEPIVIARRTGCPVCVARDRSRAAQMLIDHGVDIVLADDGLQHYRLCRDFEIVVIDGERGLGNGHLLPAGPLRESAARLGEVDLVLINGRGNDAIAGQRFGLVTDGATSLDGRRCRPLAEFAGQHVWAVAGIGNPARFLKMLENAGMTADLVPVPDHGRISLADLQLAERRPVLMTEKDAIKYSGSTDQDVWYVPVRVEMGSKGVESALISQILTGCGLANLDG
ncbi:MAG: tetraacyldisaccharide 4'-kinase [Gammaproteobacteria bacterium]